MSWCRARARSTNGKALFDLRGQHHDQEHRITGAQVTDRNGAGIRYEGGNLTVINSYFHDNQEGIPGVRRSHRHDHDRAQRICPQRLRRRYSHGIYIAHIAQLTVTDSYFHDTSIGHHLKSRAANNTITNNIFDDGAGGTSSYAVDLPQRRQCGGRRKLFRQAATGDSDIVVHFGGENNYYANSTLVLDKNTLVDQVATGGLWVRNETTAGTVQDHDNAIFGAQTRLSQGAVNVYQDTRYALTDAPSLPRWSLGDPGRRDLVGRARFGRCRHSLRDQDRVGRRRDADREQ